MFTTPPSITSRLCCRPPLPLQIAKRQAVVNPENTFFSVKRFIGRKMSEVQEESKQVPYRVVADGNGNVKIASSNANKEFAPEEISAIVLRKVGQVLGGQDQGSPGGGVRQLSHQACAGHA